MIKDPLYKGSAGWDSACALDIVSLPGRLFSRIETMEYALSDASAVQVGTGALNPKP